MVSILQYNIHNVAVEKKMNVCLISNTLHFNIQICSWLCSYMVKYVRWRKNQKLNQTREKEKTEKKNCINAQQTIKLDENLILVAVKIVCC